MSRVIPSTKYLLTFLAIPVFLSVAGCVSAPVTPDKPPEAPAKVYGKISKTLTVQAVSGGEKSPTSIWTVNVPKVDNDRFRSLLTERIRTSGLFNDVRTDIGGDYALRSEIIFQDITAPGMINTSMLLVHYELTSQKTGRIIWKENIYTQREMSTKETFVGSQRIVKLLEKGIAENMSVLIERLSRRLVAHR